MEYLVRRAHEFEAKLLSDLASRSKAHWPYDKEYLDLCQSVTHVTPEDINQWPFIVVVVDDVVVAFAAVAEVKGEKMLDHMWVEPAFIGKGLGKILFLESIGLAKELGWASFTIAADPFAEKFYLHMGAKRIGERESKIKKGFFLPLLQFTF